MWIFRLFTWIPKHLSRLASRSRNHNLSMGQRLIRCDGTAHL